ncbi:hypothetical protein DENSPDRAFT_881820 [Dentipellis sp. KUC8613]|nr:hypothetical protein DENSPDRAFT_881820 [Dentipellis sp. KUC8613]
MRVPAAYLPAVVPVHVSCVSHAPSSPSSCRRTILTPSLRRCFGLRLFASSCRCHPSHAQHRGALLLVPSLHRRAVVRGKPVLLADGGSRDVGQRCGLQWRHWGAQQCLAAFGWIPACGCCFAHPSLMHPLAPCPSKTTRPSNALLTPSRRPITSAVVSCTRIRRTLLPQQRRKPQSCMCVLAPLHPRQNVALSSYRRPCLARLSRLSCLSCLSHLSHLSRLSRALVAPLHCRAGLAHSLPHHARAP